LTPPRSTGESTTREWLLAILHDAVIWSVVAYAYLWAVTPAQGQELDYDSLPWDSVCDITNDQGEWMDGQWAKPGGSATLVCVRDGVGYLSTCAHTFENGGRTAKVTFRGQDATWAARAVAVDHRSDLAVFTINNPPEVPIPPVKISVEGGSVVTAVGFPYYGKGNMHFTSGRLVGRDGGGRLLFAAKPHVHSGYSGGALFGPSGEYLGAISGFGDDGVSIASSGEPLRRLLSRYVEVQE
jgi:S1-C subfamily serine protease